MSRLLFNFARFKMTHHWKEAKPKAADRLRDSFRNISSEDLTQILDSHEAWVRTDGARGFPADLNHGDFRGHDFSRAMLDGADLTGARLEKANFSHSSLVKATLMGALLDGADLTGVNLSGADVTGLSGLETAVLQGADFTNARGVNGHAFAGQDLTGVTLPSALESFGGVRQVEEISRPAKSIFLSLIGACLYAWLTIGASSDANLIVNAASAPLPIIQAPVPMVGFFIAGPAILFVLYLYLHLYLARLWRELGALPAIFPNGRQLDHSIFPWLLNCLAPWHIKKLNERRQPAHWLQVGLSVFAAWVMAPLTLLGFWARQIPRHDGALSFYLLILLLACAGAGIYFYWQAEKALRKEPSWFGNKWREVSGALAGCILLLAFWVHSVAAFGGAGWQIDSFGLRTFAQLEGAALSASAAVQTFARQPTGTSRSKLWPGAVVGGRFEGRDFRNARAEGLFAANGKFNQADFYGADLYSTVFSGADLIQTTFTRAILSRSDLSDAVAIKADFTLAVLYRANLTRADFTGAVLRRADLREANFTAAILNGADLSDADLSSARGLTESQLSSACGNASTQLPAKFEEATLSPCASS